MLQSSGRAKDRGGNDDHRQASGRIVGWSRFPIPVHCRVLLVRVREAERSKQWDCIIFIRYSNMRPQYCTSSTDPYIGCIVQLPSLLRCQRYSIVHQSLVANLVVPSLPCHIPSLLHRPLQPLQLFQHDQVRIEKPVHALPHARLLVLVELSVLDRAAGNALLEACIRQAVNGYV